MGDIELQIFADRLKELRTENGLTQIQFVDGLGITASALSAYEKNLKNPSISVAKRIAEKYNVSIDWLCGLTEKKTNSDIPQTLADILTMLFLIDEYSDIQIYANDDIVECKNSDGHICSLEKSTIHEIGFQPYTIDEIISDWEKMRNLYKIETIDKDVYLLWKEKTLKKARNLSPSGYSLCKDQSRVSAHNDQTEYHKEEPENSTALKGTDN